MIKTSKLAVMRVLQVLLSVALMLVYVSAARADDSQRIPASAYRTEGQGTFRRLILREHGSSTYEVWQVDRDGKVQHALFAVSLPGGATPIESDDYHVTAVGKSCGKASIQLYRDQGQVVRWIIIFSFKGSVEPLSATGKPPTASELAYDEQDVQRVRNAAKNPNLYSSLGVKARTLLDTGIPSCS